jgi:predicted ArsR family transcriptional regulator
VRNVATDPDALRHRALAQPTRLRLLHLLEAAAPLDVHALASQLGLSPNGVRRHLAVLARAGLVSSSPGPAVPSRPGRPRLVYGVAPRGRRERGGYPLLAEMLAGTLLRVGDEAAVAEEGRRWGRRLVERPLPPAPVEAAEASARLAAMLDRLGFAPRVSDTEAGVRVDIRCCPFLDTARDYPGVVCSLHLGLIEGALAELDAPLAAERLDPLVEPTLCVAHLRAAAVSRS